MIQQTDLENHEFYCILDSKEQAESLVALIDVLNEQDLELAQYEEALKDAGYNPFFGEKSIVGARPIIRKPKPQ